MTMVTCFRKDFLCEGYNLSSSKNIDHKLANAVTLITPPLRNADQQKTSNKRSVLKIDSAMKKDINWTNATKTEHWITRLDSTL